MGWIGWNGLIMIELSEGWKFSLIHFCTRNYGVFSWLFFFFFSFLVIRHTCYQRISHQGRRRHRRCQHRRGDRWVRCPPAGAQIRGGVQPPVQVQSRGQRRAAMATGARVLCVGQGAGGERSRPPEERADGGGLHLRQASSGAQQQEPEMSLGGSTRCSLFSSFFCKHVHMEGMSPFLSSPKSTLCALVEMNIIQII